jgi:hypothetical protein
MGQVSKGWIGVDLDGTLARWGHWGDIRNIGEPIIPMVERVKQWLREGQEVRIVTARACPPYIPDTIEFSDVEKAIQDWTEEHIGERLAVQFWKDLDMIELWDDRCVQVEPNTGEPTTYWVSRIK